MTNGLLDTLEFVATTLDELATPWALVGGLAISTYVEPRFTRDIDIAVAAEDDEIAVRRPRSAAPGRNGCEESLPGNE